MKRLSDQALILEAIGQVRKELHEGMTDKEMWDVMTRLSTLYSLLNVKQLKRVVELIDDRAMDERKVA